MNPYVHAKAYSGFMISIFLIETVDPWTWTFSSGPTPTIFPMMSAVNKVD